MNIIATMNAGSIPANVWVHDMEVGGGRIIGEACHFIDLITYFTGSKVKAVCMNAMGVNPEENTDNASILLKYENGSTGGNQLFRKWIQSLLQRRVEVFHRKERLLWTILERPKALVLKAFLNSKLNWIRAIKSNLSCL